MSSNNPKKISRYENQRIRRPLFLAAIFFALILFLVSAGAIYDKVYENKIFPGVKINSTALGGKTKEEAREIIQKMGDQLISQGLTFSYKSRKVNINPVISSPTDPDLAYEILSFNTDLMASDAFLTGREKENNFIFEFANNFFEQTKTLTFGKKIPINYKLNEGKFEEILKENFKDLEIESRDAKLEINTEERPYKINITKEESGQIFNYKLAIEELKNNINFSLIKPVELRSEPSEPKIFKKDVLNLPALAEEILNLAPLTLIYKDQKWTLEQSQIAPWLEFQLSPLIKGRAEGEVIIGFNKELLIDYLQTIAKEINVEAKDAKFEITDGKVIKFQNSQSGLEVDLEENYKKINQIVADQKLNQIELLVKESLPNIALLNANNLGIKEIIGVGKSNFKGSPKNRRHNIRTGVNKLNGILIKPDEEFSLLKALGEVNKETGYLEELVIKGDRTIPEFGGGLCQIGTTTFRAALDAGLPITARQNHSYRVVYYEPAGTDATIYDPWPDFKFLNDTGNWILFVAKIEGDNLIFEFWGAKDGRKVEQTKSRVYNIVKPPPLKEIKTADLAPGEKKCTERAHDGADAEFSRTVTYANGEIKKEVWRSHYKPWQAVCLIGVKPEELTSADNPITELSPDSAQSDINANANTNNNLSTN